jgi:hypothetical protein
MKGEKNGINIELEVYPYNPITERFEGMEEEKRAWVNNFYRAAGYALFLAKQENDTSLRQGYILLDNAVEQFLKSYLRIVVKISFERDKIYFDEVIKIARKNIENSTDILDRIIEFHNTRNKLYHSSIYLSISKSRFLDYLDDVFSLCKLIGFADISDIVSNEFTKIIQKVFDKQDEKRYTSLRRIEDMLKNNFGITPEIYEGDIFLCSVPDDWSSAIDGIESILFGVLGRKEVDGKKARVLEVIDANSEYADHSFFISYANSSAWYCFYDCIRSKGGEDNDVRIQEIRELIKQNEDNIEYRKDYKRKKYFHDAFDPFFIGEIL